MVDEYIVCVGKSEDNTLELVKSIKSNKIKIIETVWNEENLRGGGELAVQANITLSHCSGDWAFYLQPDEVIHEDDLPIIQSAFKKYFNNHQILAFAFYFLHFTGDYWTLNPWDFHKEVRIIRNKGELIVGGDSGQIMRKSDGVHFGRKFFGKEIIILNARIFHYGWVKKPEVVRTKIEEQRKLWFGKGEFSIKERKGREQVWSYYEKLDILKPFNGTHPKVMEERVKNFPKVRKKNRWLVFDFYKEMFKRGFRG